MRKASIDRRRTDRVVAGGPSLGVVLLLHRHPGAAAEPPSRSCRPPLPPCEPPNIVPLTPVGAARQGHRSTTTPCRIPRATPASLPRPRRRASRRGPSSDGQCDLRRPAAGGRPRPVRQSQAHDATPCRVQPRRPVLRRQRWGSTSAATSGMVAPRRHPHQAQEPFINPNEMDNTPTNGIYPPVSGGYSPLVVQKVQSRPYTPLFKQMYGQDVFTKYTPRRSTTHHHATRSRRTRPRPRSTRSARSTTPPSMACRRRTCTRSPHPRSAGGILYVVGPNPQHPTRRGPMLPVPLVRGACPDSPYRR